MDTFVEEELITVKFGKKGAWILLYVHVVAGEKSLEELGLFGLQRFDDELVVVRQPEQGARRPRISDFHWREFWSKEMAINTLQGVMSLRFNSSNPCRYAN